MRRRGSGGGGGDGEAHVTINVQEETVRSRGMGSRATTAAAAAAAAASGGPGGTPLDALLKEPGAGKHAEVLRYLKKTLDEERREFSRLQQDVFDSLTEHEVSGRVYEGVMVWTVSRLPMESLLYIHARARLLIITNINVRPSFVNHSTTSHHPHHPIR